jgi:hypothetical protein
MIINEKIMTETIQEALADQDDVRSVMTYDEAGMLTRDAGLVVRISDGSEFQITVVQSR